MGYTPLLLFFLSRLRTPSPHPHTNCRPYFTDNLRAPIRQGNCKNGGSVLERETKLYGENADQTERVKSNLSLFPSPPTPRPSTPYEMRKSDKDGKTREREVSERRGKIVETGRNRERKGHSKRAWKEVGNILRRKDSGEENNLGLARWMFQRYEKNPKKEQICLHSLWKPLPPPHYPSTPTPTTKNLIHRQTPKSIILKTPLMFLDINSLGK